MKGAALELAEARRRLEEAEEALRWARKRLACREQQYSFLLDYVRRLKRAERRC